ncbi:imelysin family protein [Roseovarius sp. CAU 1744]|uniref:imelysin family protein n=1 Tax=Roseovarius sp. CAU 1744 TaxID=3140368 RepID=UPI00325B9F09
MRTLCCMFLLCIVLPVTANADRNAELIRNIVEEEIIGGFDALETAAERLADTAAETCAGADLTAAYSKAFRAWIRVSHLRFGPSEEDNRAFALTFWPDPRGSTPKTLRKLLSDQGEAAPDVAAYRNISVAARGFHALDYLLGDPDLRSRRQEDRYCALVAVIAQDIFATARDLARAWRSYAPGLIDPGKDTPYRTQQEVLQVLYKSARTGLQFTADMRFGRPLGTVEKPRPKRAEAWRSGLSQILAGEAVAGSGGLALKLARDNPDLMKRLDNSLSRFAAGMAALDDPVFMGVLTPQGRFRIEVLLTELNGIRRIVDRDLGPNLGVAAGFNALDGD